MDQIVQADYPFRGVREKRECVTLCATVITRDLRGIDADCHQTNAACVELAEVFLETPQLGVAEGSPVPAVEDEQHRAGDDGAPDLGLEKLGESHLVTIRVRQGEIRRSLAQPRSAVGGRELPRLVEHSEDEQAADSDSKKHQDGPRDSPAVESRVVERASHSDRYRGKS